MTSKLSRRDFLRLSALAGGAAVLAACGTPATQPPAEEPAGGEEPEPAPAQAEGVVLQHWQSDWGKEWNDPMLELSDAFTADVAPNITMEWTFLADMTEKLPSAIAGGNPPDIATIDEGYGIPKMAHAGGLVSLDQYYKQDGVKGEDFIPFTWDTVLYKGEPYGIPGGAGAHALWYRKDLFEEAGIDLDSVPDTPSWDQLMEWNQLLLKKDDNGTITQLGFMDTWAWGQYRGTLGSSRHYTDDLTKLTVNDAATVAAVEQWATLIPEDITFEDIDTFLAGAPEEWFGKLGGGLQAIVADGYWSFYALDNYWPDVQYGVCKVPTPNGTKEEWKMFTGWVWDPSIPKGSPHPDEAWQFLKFGYWEHGEMLAQTLNWTSSLQSFDKFVELTEEIAGEGNQIIPYLHHFAEAQYGAEWFVSWTPIFQKLDDMMGQAIDQVLRRQLTAQEALDEVVEALQPELDKAVEDGF
jgi:ABC-type glycerol-3-phosphate transport system substrate-binding protein